MYTKARKTILLIALALLLVLVGCNKTPDATTSTMEADGTTASTTTTTTTTPPPSGGNSGDPAATCAVTVINGTANGAYSGSYPEGGEITLHAAIAHKGYSFSHWENASGETVGTTSECKVTVTQNETYKAYYQASFGSITESTSILTDLSKDWQQGGINGKFDAFNKGDKTRISMTEPFLLRAGETFEITVPADTWVCPYETTPTEGKTPCENGCTIAIARMILKKNEGSATGDLLTDYTTVAKTAWVYGGFRYEATEDVYIMLTLKYDSHGGLSFNVDKSVVKQMTVTLTTTKESAPTDSPIGEYWEPEVNDAIEKIEANRESIGEGVSEFFFITDVHWKDYNAHYSPALINYLADKLDTYNVVFGGDIIEENKTREGAINDEILPFFAALTDYTKEGEKLNILSTIGNHDRNCIKSIIDPNAAAVLSDKDIYNLFVARTEGWAVSPDGNPYASYFDDTENKIRYLQFTYASNTVNLAADLFEDAMQWSEEQITSLPADWIVILFTHGIYGGNQNEAAFAVTDRVLSWQEKADAEIAILISGHTHSDNDTIYVSKDGKTALRMISLNCDSSGKKGSGSFPMQYKTATEQSFAFLQVDKANQTIYLTRIGAGGDLVFTYGDAMKDEYEAAPQYSIRVVNGTVNGSFYARVAEGTELYLSPDPAPTGYTFSCWKDYEGNVVGTTQTLTITASKSTQYQPYYIDSNPTDDIAVEGAVMTNLANDWTYGGVSTLPAIWYLDGSIRDTRTCFAQPILLKKGQTIRVTLPQITCPTGQCTSGCKLVSLIAVMKKTGDSDTHDMPSEYTVIKSSWTSTYTATEDVYVVVMIKYNTHGSITFTARSEEMKKVVITIK